MTEDPPIAHIHCNDRIGNDIYPLSIEFQEMLSARVRVISKCLSGELNLISWATVQLPKSIKTNTSSEVVIVVELMELPGYSTFIVRYILLYFKKWMKWLLEGVVVCFILYVGFDVQFTIKVSNLKIERPIDFRLR